MKAPIVPIHVHDAVRRHARQVKPGKEIVGTLFVKRGVVKRYVRRRNLCRNLWSFSVQGIGEGIRPGESAVLIHSHPGPGYDHPSPGDLKQATSRVLRKPYAIYNNETDTIAFFKISRRSYKRLKPPYKRLPKP